MTHIHANIRSDDSRLAMRVVHQGPAVAKHLPLHTDGCDITTVGSGRPFIGIVGGKLTIGLRGPECPDAYRQEPVVAVMPNAKCHAAAAKSAVSALRNACRADEISARTAFHKMVASIPAIAGGC